MSFLFFHHIKLQTMNTYKRLFRFSITHLAVCLGIISSIVLSNAHILAQTPEAIIVQIEDISGRLLISQPLQSGTNTIEMNALVPGMYLYRILEGNMVTMIGKIAKD